MSKKEKPENIGVINPFALAEVTMARRINWKRIASPRALLEKTLKVPYDKLFDPKYESPLYVGLQLDRKTLRMSRSEIAPTAKGVHSHLKAINVEAATVWIDPGDFFEEATEMTDPVQGALGDCYFIAALSSVAWARPYVIAHRNRATGVGQQQFTDMVQFYKGTKPEMVEVTELLPMQSPANTYIYARSSESGEIWPAVYEKAYAKWRTNDTDDTPAYAPIAGGDPVAAMSQLTGLTAHYQWNSSLPAHDIWQKIRANSISYKTFNPMVAWTYGSSPSPDVNYSSAHLAANHAYSILGWGYANSQEYIILRNPWGTYEATLNAPNITWVAWDQPYYGAGKGNWRPIQLSTVDGIFGLRSDTFKSYFAGFGWVTTPEAP
jgi:hypothetical protein